MSRVFAAFVALAAVLFSAAPASADLVKTLNNGEFGPGNYGTVTLQQVGACTALTVCEVQVTVALSNSSKFVTTGGGHITFAFNLSGDPSLTDNGCTTNDCIVITSNSSDYTFEDTSQSPPGVSGTFDYGIADNLGNGGSNAIASPLVFDVYATGLTPSSFIANGSHYFFAADILTSGSKGSTGEVGALPEPTTLLTFGAGLAGLAFLLGRRRKRRRA